MKKFLKFLLAFTIAILLKQSACISQVNLEHDYLMDGEFFLTNLGNNDYKYVLFDSYDSKFSLYNLDHTPFLLNIQIPLQVWDSIEQVSYQLGYITKTLFDCDSSTIEYAMMLNTPHPDKHPNTGIFRTDGSLIFSKDTVGTMFCVGCGSGSYEIHPIMNTPAGAKMYFFTHDSIGMTHVLVYGLCDVLPETIVETDQSSFSYVKVYPNPSTHYVRFDIILPSNFEEYELSILNSNFQVIKSEVINGLKTQVILDDELLSSGTYFYLLQRKNKVFQTGKFIIKR
jgi:hypothetical protein